MTESRTSPLRSTTALLEFGQTLEERFETNWDVFINRRLFFGLFPPRLKRPETRRNKRTSPLKSLECIIHTGSSPVPGTKSKKTSVNAGFFVPPFNDYSANLGRFCHRFGPLKIEKKRENFSTPDKKHQRNDGIWASCSRAQRSETKSTIPKHRETKALWTFCELFSKW